MQELTGGELTLLTCYPPRPTYIIASENAIRTALLKIFWRQHVDQPLDLRVRNTRLVD